MLCYDHIELVPLSDDGHKRCLQVEYTTEPCTALINNADCIVLGTATPVFSGYRASMQQENVEALADLTR